MTLTTREPNKCVGQICSINFAGEALFCTQAEGGSTPSWSSSFAFETLIGEAQLGKLAEDGSSPSKSSNGSLV